MAVLREVIRHEPASLAQLAGAVVAKVEAAQPLGLSEQRTGNVALTYRRNRTKEVTVIQSL